jgi:hypothetical protein
MGGDHCASAKSDSSDNGGGGGGLSGLAANAGGKLLGGLFAKKNAPGANDSTQGAVAANAAPPLPDGYAQIIAFTTETTAVTTAPIAPEQFDLPAGWALEQPKPNNKSRDFSCPTPSS